MKKILYRIVLVLCLLLLIYSSYSIIKWFLENNKSNDIKTHVVKITAIEEEKDKYPYISIDFTNLLKENNKVKGWIQVPNTNINYPVLQYSDNDYYLNHDYYNNYSTAGWIFLDYRNNNDDTNMILYGHNRLDGSMFGTLKDTLKEDYLNKNKYIYFNTLDSKNTYEVFSVYKINASKFNAYTNFQSDEEYNNYINEIKNRSIIKLDVDINTNDKIITLYTCDNNNVDRTILHAKLIQTKSNS